MPYPYIAASGCYGYGYEAQSFFPGKKLKWGAVTTKTITLNPRQGNPPPRIFESSCGVINRIGMQNCGLDSFIKEKLPEIKKLPYPAVISIFGENKEEWTELLQTLGKNKADAVELNFSCPNLKGEVLTKNRQKCLNIAEYLVEISPIPVWIKINAVDSPVELAQSFESFKISALVCSNTIPAAFVLNKKIYRGGLSGPAIKPAALKAVESISRQSRIDVAACGGISTRRDIEDYRLAGAGAFVIGTALLKRPDIANIIHDKKDKEGI